MSPASGFDPPGAVSDDPDRFAGARGDSPRIEERGDPRRDPPAWRELADHPHPPWLAGRDQVVEDRVDRMLVEDPSVAILDEVAFQTLQLDARRARDVGDDDRPEVGLP